MAAVAGNNMVALRGTRDLFDSWKKCRANIASEAQLKKLTKRQRCASRLTALAASPTLPAPATLPAPGAACCPRLALLAARLGSDARLRARAAPRLLEAPQPPPPQGPLCDHRRVPKSPRSPPVCSDPPRLAFYFNAALLSIHMNKPDQCKEVRSALAPTLSLRRRPSLRLRPSLSSTPGLRPARPWPHP